MSNDDLKKAWEEHRKSHYRKIKGKDYSSNQPRDNKQVKSKSSSKLPAYRHEQKRNKYSDHYKIIYGDYEHGKYGSYGNRDLVTVQCKADRQLVKDFDETCRLLKQTRKEAFECFMTYYAQDLYPSILERNSTILQQIQEKENENK